MLHFKWVILLAFLVVFFGGLSSQTKADSISCYVGPGCNAFPECIGGYSNYGYSYACNCAQNEVAECKGRDIACFAPLSECQGVYAYAEDCVCNPPPPSSVICSDGGREGDTRPCSEGACTNGVQTCYLDGYQKTGGWSNCDYSSTPGTSTIFCEEYPGYVCGPNDSGPVNNFHTCSGLNPSCLLDSPSYFYGDGLCRLPPGSGYPSAWGGPIEICDSGCNVVSCNEATKPNCGSGTCGGTTTCNASTGQWSACSYPGPSTSCDDNNACTPSSSCSSGTCSGTNGPVQGTLSGWSTCTAACGGGTCTQTRTCTGNSCGGNCSGASLTQTYTNNTACAIPPTASLTANGQHMHTATSLSVNTPVTYNWFSQYGTSYSSTWTSSPASSCFSPAQASGNWVINNTNGSSGSDSSGAIASCQQGQTWTLTYTVTNSIGQTASDSVVIFIPPSAPVCSASTNTCATGAVTDTADGACTNNWQCTNGGSTVSCSSAKPAVNGSLSGWGSCNVVAGTCGGIKTQTCTGASCGGDATCGGVSLSQSCTASNGTSCNDSNACSSGEICQSGTCQGGSPAPGSHCQSTACVANTTSACSPSCSGPQDCGGCNPTTYNSSNSGIYDSTGVTQISTITASQPYKVKCDFNAAGTPNIPLPSGCTFNTFSGTTALFNCTAPSAAQSLSVSCSLNNATPDYFCAQNHSLGNLTVLGGSCTPNQSYACGSAPCTGTQTCNSSGTGFTGACNYSPSNNSACSTGNSCKIGETCQSGTCQGGGAISGSHCLSTSCVVNTTSSCAPSCTTNQDCGACVTLTFRPATSGFSGSSSGPAASSLPVNSGANFYAFVDYGQINDAIIIPVSGSYTCTDSGVWLGTARRFNCTAPASANSYSYTTGTNGGTSSNICASGSVSIGTITVNAANQAPVAAAIISKDGSTYAGSITVTQGVATPVYLSASGSTDPNGWTDAINGVSSGGKCEWNSDFNQGSPTYENTINNPPSASPGCNKFLGNLTFNDAPATYTYQVLRITDKPGAQSNVATVQVIVTSAGGGSCNPEPWYNASWGYRKKVAINGGQVSGSSALSNFPVLISFTDPDFKFTGNGGKVGKSDGTDIVVTSNGIKLDHEIEKYVPSTGEVVIWARVPSLVPGSDMPLYLYYGYAGASNQQNVTGTWDSNYKGVWHLKDGSSLSASDSTGVNNGSIVGAMSATAGKIDGAASDSASGNINIPYSAGLGLTSSYTVESWVHTSSCGSLGYIIDKWQYSSGGNRSWSLDCGGGPGGTIEWRASRDGSDDDLTHFSVVSSSMVYNAWAHVAGVYDGSSKLLKLYINGLSVGTPASLIMTKSTLKPLYIGGGDDGTQWRFPGSVDESRYSSVARSADWIKTEYNNQSNPGAFYSLAGQEDNTVCNPSNQAPVAAATISKDGSTYAGSITVTQGVATPVYLSAAGSTDPNGWTDATNGVSSGGKCEWNYDLEQGASPVYEVTVDNPSTVPNCSNFIANGTIKTFNDAPGTYTYNVLKITDKPGAVSNPVGTVQIVVQASTPPPTDGGNCNSSMSCPGGNGGGNTEQCGYVHMTWQDNSGGTAAFKIYKDGVYIGVTTAVGATNYDYQPGDTNNHTYGVSAIKNGVDSSIHVLENNNPIATFACSADLGDSDKDIVSVNNTTVDYNSTLPGNQPPQVCNSSTDTLPANIVLKIGDNLGFRINLCNDQGQAVATGITVTDTMSNLQMPTAGWGAKYNGANLTYDGTSNSGQANHYYVSGAAPNQTLTFNLTSSGDNINAHGGATLTFTAQLTVPSGTTATQSRFQNIFRASYNGTQNVNRATPWLLFYTGKGVPSIIEVP